MLWVDSVYWLAKMLARLNLDDMVGMAPKTGGLVDLDARLTT